MYSLLYEEDWDWRLEHINRNYNFICFLGIVKETCTGQLWHEYLNHVKTVHNVEIRDGND